MEPRRKGLHIDPSDLTLEIVSIVVAILLALAVNRWQEGLAHEHVLRESLVNIRRELADNRATLVEKMPIHEHVAGAFRRFLNADDPRTTITFSGLYRIFTRAAPRGFQPVKGDDVAWQIAQSSQAASYMPYATRYALTQVYDEQALLYTAEQRFVDAAFSPSAGKDYSAQAFVAALWVSEVTVREPRLLRRYDAALAMLPSP